MNLLFVFGTLRRGSGHPMSAWLEAHGVWLGRDTAPGSLYHFGWHPALVPGPGVVHGDVYRVQMETLHALDAWEGRAFRRVRSGRYWLYAYAGDVSGRRRILSGDWLRREGMALAAPA